MLGVFGVGLAAAFALIATCAEAASDGGVFQWQTVGEQTYTTYCAACHQPNGQGVADTVPRSGRACAGAPGETGGS